MEKRSFRSVPARLALLALAMLGAALLSLCLGAAAVSPGRFCRCFRAAGRARRRQAYFVCAPAAHIGMPVGRRGAGGVRRGHPDSAGKPAGRAQHHRRQFRRGAGRGAVLRSAADGGCRGALCGVPGGVRRGDAGASDLGKGGRVPYDAGAGGRGHLRNVRGGHRRGAHGIPGLPHRLFGFPHRRPGQPVHGQGRACGVGDPSVPGAALALANEMDVLALGADTARSLACGCAACAWRCWRWRRRWQARL